MTQNHHVPISVGATNHPDTVNVPFGQLDQALTTGMAVLQDAIDAVIAESGTSDAEVIAARTRIKYLAGTPPTVLGDTIAHVGRNQIHVDAYGAVGNNIANDVAAIQAALDAAVAGDTIVFSAGKTYRVPTTIEIKDDNITLIGYGATLNATELDNDTVDVNACIEVTSVDKIRIIGLTLIGPSSEDTDDILTIEGNTTGIYLASSNDCMVRDCRIEGFFRGGIFVFIGNNHSIIGNHLHRVRYRLPELGSIAIQGSVGTTVVGNVITGVWGSGVSAQNSYRCTIQGNVIDGQDQDEAGWGQAQSMGICTYNCSWFSITGNTIHNVTDEGIILVTGGGETASNYNTVVGNIVHNAKLFGINLRAQGGTVSHPNISQYNVVSGNIVFVDEFVPGGS